MFYVYKIEISGVVRYIGMTDNLKRRQNQHTRAYIKGDSKYLYKQIRLNAPDEPISLEIVREFDNRGDCKRYEALLILENYFRDRNLWQSFPVGIKYF
jgi:predicted GIY-YIG superfamily endonuclease